LVKRQSTKRHFVHDLTSKDVSSKIRLDFIVPYASWTPIIAVDIAM